MSKIASIMLITTILLSMFLIFNSVHAATSVSGSITSNTTWTKANSPYKMTGVVTVQEGVTLTIEPGVTFELGGWYMYIRGHLHAEGKSYDQIHFTAEITGHIPAIYLETTSNDCIIKNVVLDRVGLVIRGGSPNITNNVFLRSQRASIDVETSSPSITGNIFEDIPTKGISVTDSTEVTNNLFNRTTGQATAIIATGNAHIARNQITGFYQGIVFEGKIIVENNVVINCTSGGIYSSGSSGIIKGNYLSANDCGINSGGMIESNTIVNNHVGIGIPTSLATIKNNNIVSNQNGITVTSKGNFDATNNYWGNIDSLTVDTLIIDSQDNPALGTVNYKSMLASPSASAPDDEILKEIAASTGTSTSSLGFLIFVEDNIFLIAEITIGGIAIAWVIVIAVVLVKKRRGHKRL